MTNKEEIKKCLTTLFPLTEPYEHIVEVVEGKICINGFCYLPIKVSYHFDREASITIFDEQSDEFGQIYFSGITQSVEIHSLNQAAYTAFLVEYPNETIQVSEHKLLHDYVVIKKEKLKVYLDDYKKKSAIWGGYFHIEDLPNNTFSLTKTYNQLTAIKDIDISKPYYSELLEQIVLETNPFNRFLKLYHLLEMQFDMHTARQIEKLLDQGDKEKEISETLRDYVRDDIERLKSLFKINLDKSKLAPFLSNILTHKSTAKKIFYYKEKESNPLRSEKKFDTLFDKTAINQTTFDQVFGTEWYNEKIHSVIAYWIYRVRSCIAHNKLGEYVMKKNDENFIIDFAEPLIREVIIQCYKVQ
jgi:hypothetical protein